MSVHLWPDNAIVTHPRNRNGRDLVTGDVHGHLDTLEHALAQLHFDPVHDRLFSVGDLIDRGPRSHDALGWIEQQRIAAVRGNHEQMMMEALALEGGALHKSGAGAHWRDNGGGWWWGWSGKFADEHGMPLGPKHGPDHNERRERWLETLAKMPVARTIETGEGDVGIVHTLSHYHRSWTAICHDLDAGSAEQRERHRQGRSMTTGPPVGLLWGRPDVEREERGAGDLPEAIEDVTLVVTGHTPGAAPRWTRRNALCIDTGVHIHHDGYGHLTIAEIGTAEPTLHRFRRRDPA